MNEEFIKDYLLKLGKSIQEDLNIISTMPWNNPHVFIKLGELTQSIRNAKDSCQSFKDYLKELATENIAQGEPNCEENSREETND